MLEALRSFLDDLTAGNRAETAAPDEAQVAAVALLVHIAGVDGTVDAAEATRLERLVQQRYALDASAARALIAQATANEREAVDLFGFTHILKRQLDEAGRQAIVEALWEMAYADGSVHEFEENIIWRVAELLGVSARERVELRQRAEREGPEEVKTPTPWGAALKGGTT